jgi:hypothetical protein
MSKTMSVRMDRDNYDFLHEFTKEERSDLSKAVRDMVRREPAVATHQFTT